LLKEEHPRINCTVLCEEWRNLKLVRDVEDFANKVKNLESNLVFQIAEQVVYQVAQNAKTLLLNVVKRDTILFQLKFVLFYKTKQSEQARVNALFVIGVEVGWDVLRKQAGPLIGVVEPRHSRNAPSVLLDDNLVLALEYLLNYHLTNALLVMFF
jgi:hypothetical protein